MKTLCAAFLCVLVTLQVVLAQEAAPTTAPAKQDPATPSIKYEKDGISPNPGFMKNHEKFVARAKQGNVDVVFLGDSITAGWANNGKEIWKETYDPRNAANFGIGGDRTQHVLWRIENGELENIQPKVAVVMIGTNNTAQDDPDKIAAGVTKIVKTVRDKTGAKVLLLGVFPRGENPEKGGEQRKKITRINEVISKLDDGKTVRFLDLKDKFIQPDGTIAKEIMPDYLHLSPAGYKIWAESMEPLLSEMLEQ